MTALAFINLKSNKIDDAIFGRFSILKIKIIWFVGIEIFKNHQLGKMN